MGVMIAASTTPGLDGSEEKRADPGTARSPIWRNMDSSSDSRLF